MSRKSCQRDLSLCLSTCHVLLSFLLLLGVRAGRSSPDELLMPHAASRQWQVNTPPGALFLPWEPCELPGSQKPGRAALHGLITGRPCFMHAAAWPCPAAPSCCCACASCSQSTSLAQTSQSSELACWRDAGMPGEGVGGGCTRQEEGISQHLLDPQA